MAQEKRRNWVLIDACLVGLPPLRESFGERLEDIKYFGMGLSPKKPSKNNLFILMANLPTMIGQNRPQEDSYVNEALVLLGQFFDSL